MRKLGRIGARRFSIDSELRVNFREELRGIPLAGMLLARAIRVDEVERDIVGFSENVLALILAFERGAANRVNRFALLVHHVVVFEQVFASVEVLRFDGFLRLFDAARDEFRFDGHAFGHAEAEHQRFDAFAAEDAHEVVFER